MKITASNTQQLINQNLAKVEKNSTRESPVNSESVSFQERLGDGLRNVSEAQKDAAEIAKNANVKHLLIYHAIPTPTNKTDPTGGVQRPIQRLSISTIPKWVGSIPKAVTIGRKIGVKISTAGVASIKTPTANKITLIINNIIILLSLIDNKALLIS